MKSGQDSFLTIQALQRMPYYLEYLKEARSRGDRNVSAASIASELGLSDVLVRKDIASVSTRSGRPKAGFEVDSLIDDIENYMGFHELKEAVLVGAGSLGKALLRNGEFEKYGFRIAAAFDVKRSLFHKKVNGVEVFSVRKLAAFCRERHIRFGIVTVPVSSAQQTADLLVSGGVRAIWNFALIKLNVPEGVLVWNEDLASSLAMLSRHVTCDNEMK